MIETEQGNDGSVIITMTDVCETQAKAYAHSFDDMVPTVIASMDRRQYIVVLRPADQVLDRTRMAA